MEQYVNATIESFECDVKDLKKIKNKFKEEMFDIAKEKVSSYVCGHTMEILEYSGIISDILKLDKGGLAWLQK